MMARFQISFPVKISSPISPLLHRLFPVTCRAIRKPPDLGIPKILSITSWPVTHIHLLWLPDIQVDRFDLAYMCPH